MVSADGTKLETVTVTWYQAEKLILRITMENLPLVEYFKYSSDFRWKYGVYNNAASYITDYYAASYYADGKKQTDTRAA
jgi:hypothetical protein